MNQWILIILLQHDEYENNRRGSINQIEGEN